MNNKQSLLERKCKLQQEIKERQREIDYIDSQLLQHSQYGFFDPIELREREAEEAAAEFQRNQEQLRWQKQQSKREAEEAAAEFQRNQEQLRWQKQQSKREAEEAAAEFQRNQEQLRWQKQMRDKTNPFQTPPPIDL